ncbi:hypothetical protein VTJ83DRAFT_7028 [Remersonia thermophila]|uniref:Uncharacterized protein n=1 Tax=Remersonia thermophila TaxID=72144 RepID=A0ABR4D2B6_9PEZI
MTPAFQPIFPPTTSRPGEKPRGNQLALLVKSTFHLSTLLLLGAFVQGILSLILSPRYALLPAVVLLLRTAIHAVQNLSASSASNYYVRTQGVIPGKTSARLPHSWLTSSKAAAGEETRQGQGIVVFHIGVRFHHPLGPPGTPHARELGEYFQACHATLLSEAKKYGCLGGSAYRGERSEGGDNSNMLLNVYYFRDLEGLERFAREKEGVHMKAWEWFDRLALSSSSPAQPEGEGGDGKTANSRARHFGIFHETFSVPAGRWETLYMNMPPTLLGAGSVAVKNAETGREEWVKTLVDAEGREFRSMRARMGVNQ